MKLRPRVETFCFRGNRVLAGFNHEAGYVIFPGGGIDPGESAIDAAKRETAEEAARRLINCTVAHPPSVQVWPDSYARRGEMASYDGGLTYWMTGSCSDSVQEDLVDAEEYETSMAWRKISEVLAELRRSLGNGWEDDNRIRLGILETQVNIQRPVRFADALASA